MSSVSSLLQTLHNPFCLHKFDYSKVSYVSLVRLYFSFCDWVISLNTFLVKICLDDMISCLSEF